MTHAYVVGQITVTAPDRWAEYTSRVPATLAPWRAEIVFRGKQAAVFAGSQPHAAIVVIRFPDLASAHGWFASPAYQALVPLREQAAKVDLSCYEA